MTLLTKQQYRRQYLSFATWRPPPPAASSRLRQRTPYIVRQQPPVRYVEVVGCLTYIIISRRFATYFNIGRENGAHSRPVGDFVHTSTAAAGHCRRRPYIHTRRGAAAAVAHRDHRLCLCSYVLPFVQLASEWSFSENALDIHLHLTIMPTAKTK